MFSGTTEDAYYGSDITEVFGPPQVTVESGEDIVDPLVYGDASDGYYFDGTGVSSSLEVSKVLDTDFRSTGRSYHSYLFSLTVRKKGMPYYHSRKLINRYESKKRIFVIGSKLRCC